MTTKSKALIAGVALLTAFAFGRYSAPEKVRTEVKTVEVEKKTENSEKSRETDKKTTTKKTETRKPDGTVETTEETTTETKSTTETSKSTTDDKSSTQTNTSETVRGSSYVTISALAGTRIDAPEPPVYGLHISKPVLGPITIGIFGLSNCTLGASVGLSF